MALLSDYTAHCYCSCPQHSASQRSTSGRHSEQRTYTLLKACTALLASISSNECSTMRLPQPRTP